MSGRLDRIGTIARVQAAAALLAAALGPAIAAAQGSAPLRERTVYEDLQMFSQVLNQIRVNHPDSVDTHALFMAAIEGMVAAADPHSFVIPYTRLSAEREKELREGRLVPVPITFQFVGGAPVIVSVAPGSRAARLDIIPGDELVAIEGAPISASSARELDLVLAGENGSQVALEIERRRVDGSTIRLVRSVARERIEPETAVPVALLLDADGTGYVRVTTFAHERVAHDLHSALEQLEDQGLHRLILDLRDNGGGRLDQAAEIAGEFLPRRALVYTTAGRKEETNDTVRVSRSFWSAERRYPIIVLVNQGTASAAELVAGALQDHDRALIVGRNTFGKALMMQGFPLADGSLVMLVTGTVHTPCGRSIQRTYQGISRREYYRAAADERDTLSRPACTTAGGRTVYGGGGIYPDVILPTGTAPLWFSRLLEEDLALRWLPGFLDAGGAPFPSAEDMAAKPDLDDEDLAAFRDFAAAQGVTTPDTPEARRLINRLLLVRIADIRWGNAGAYRVAIAFDGDLSKAAELFDEAAALPRQQP